MDYFITIKKTIANPNFKEQMAAFEKSDRYTRTSEMMRPDEIITKDVLVVALTEVQFAAVKKATLEVF